MNKSNEVIEAVDVLTEKGSELYEKTKAFLECLEVLLVAAAGIKSVLEKCSGGSNGK